MIKTKKELTFKHNLDRGRHGWLRLTPAYSVTLVQQILHDHPDIRLILDPFSGTGTTGLVAGENGLNCDLIDINPFLVWFAQTKTAHYQPEALQQARIATEAILTAVEKEGQTTHLWVPPIHNISRWWSEDQLWFLASVHQEIKVRFPDEGAVRNLLLVAFCRLVIEASNAAFNHQSMSFKDHNPQQLALDLAPQPLLLNRFRELVRNTVTTAKVPLKGAVQVIQADSRSIPMPQADLYDCVITSPPYPNRMSYIRELRPYMYWLGYLEEAREAGELDWQAIGGTWGIATSRLQNWQPNGVQIDNAQFQDVIAGIADRSSLLANYVYKYFVDVLVHLTSLYPALAPGAKVFYIVGNSKFYDTMVAVEQFYARLLEATGFEAVKVEILRKRNSKKELFEYIVSARKPF